MFQNNLFYYNKSTWISYSRENERYADRLVIPSLYDIWTNNILIILSRSAASDNTRIHQLNCNSSKLQRRE